MSKDHPEGTLKEHFTLRRKPKPLPHDTRTSVHAEGDKLSR